MHPELKRILRWAFIGGLVALAIDWWYSGTQQTSTRVALGIMCFGGGFVTAALLAANFSTEHDDAPGGSSH